jgi:O-methyltransferase/methyltransferase family protein
MSAAHEVPPPVQMVQMLAGFQLSQALYAAAVLGVADLMTAGPVAAGVLAEQAGAHPPSLLRLLRTLAGAGVFTEPEPGVFALTPLGSTLTRSQPGSMRDLAIMWMETHYAPFGELLHTVRSGEPAAERLYGQPFFSWLSGQPGQVTRFTGAMANLTSGIKNAAIPFRPLDGARTIVDVGGADGTMLAAILSGHPGLRGVVFDLPHVVAGAPKALAEHGVADRVDCAGGDFFDSVPAGADSYLLSFVIHDWPDEAARRILANIAAAGGSGARLMMIEFVVPPGDTPHMSKMIDLTMLGMLTGRERPEEDWRDLLTSAGFTGIAVLPTGGPLSVIQATVR